MKYVSLSLRIGLAFTFLYASIGALLYPVDWISFIPAWLENLKLAPPATLLLGHALFELILGLWLLSGKKTFFAAAIAALDLVSITLFSLNIFGIVFRDVGLIFSAIALALVYKDQIPQFLTKKG